MHDIKHFISVMLFYSHMTICILNKTKTGRYLKSIFHVYINYNVVYNNRQYKNTETNICSINSILNLSVLKYIFLLKYLFVIPLW